MVLSHFPESAVLQDSVHVGRVRGGPTRPAALHTVRAAQVLGGDRLLPPAVPRVAVVTSDAQQTRTRLDPTEHGHLGRGLLVGAQ